MKRTLKTLLTLLLASLLLVGSVCGAGAAADSTLPELHSTLRTPFYTQTINAPSEDAMIVGKIFEKTTNYRATWTLKVNVSTFEDYEGLVVLTIYDGNQLVAIGDNRTVEYTLKNVTKDHILYVKIDGVLPAFLAPGDDYVVQCNLHVETGFFEKIWGTFLSWFGVTTFVWEIYDGEQQ